MSQTGRYADYTSLSVEIERRIVTATVCNPPLNMLSRKLVADLERFTIEVAADPHPLVVILKSDDRDIFITHNEFANLYAMQPPAVPTSVEDVSLNPMHLICERLRTMDKVTIALVEGRAAGGGAAIAMACDMRFGTLDRTVFNTMSVPIGSVPGGGASQYLPPLIGRARAIELIMGGIDLDARQAELWGYLNRAMPDGETGAYVRRLAERIAAAPVAAVRSTKSLMQPFSEPIEAGLREENFYLRRLLGSGESRRGVEAFLAGGGETREGELRLEELLGEVLQGYCQ